MLADSYRARAIPSRIDSKLEQATSWFLIGFALLHIPLAFLMRGDNTIATVHAFGTLIMGLLFIVKSKNPVQVVYVAAYMAGAEVLWRMNKAAIPWEFVKYSIVLLLGLLLIRSARSLRGFGLPLIYMMLLALSVPLTLEELGFSQAALGGLSFNLSGPLCLAVAALFFRQHILQESEIRTILWMTAIPVIGVATIALNSVLTIEIYFGLGSNVAASGGYGPNQVSSTLGLGALFCLVLAIFTKEKFFIFITLTLTLWFLSQAALTLSRGGLFASVLCMIIVGLHLLRDPKKRNIALGIAATLLFIGGYFIVPELDSFTYGAVDKRMQDVNTTHRADIVLQDLEVWAENPWVGAGPGMSAGLRAKKDWTGRKYAAHTEFSRLLSEHGVAGLGAMIILVAMGWKAYARSTSLQQQALVAGLLAWSFAEMTHSAMRLGAVSFLFGLAMAHMKFSDSPTEAARTSQPEKKTSGVNRLRPGRIPV